MPSGDKAVPMASQEAPLADHAFGKILVECSTGLRSFARPLSHNRDHADDLVQETLLKAWKARGLFRAGSNIRAWTRVIMRNIFLSERRRSRFTAEWDDHVADRKLISVATQAEPIDLADVARALDRIPEVQRKAVLLFGEKGLSIEEIAVATGAPEGTVKSRIARGRTALKTILAYEPAPWPPGTDGCHGQSTPTASLAVIAADQLAAALRRRRGLLEMRRAAGIALIG